jgi:dipeptidase E
MAIRSARCRAFLGSSCLGALGPWLDELPERPASAVVIPTASKHYVEAPWVPRTFQVLAGFGIDAGFFDLEGASREAVAERLTTDLVFVTGGDALFLLKHAQLSGFSELAPPLIRAGRLAYAGVSAGAMLAGPDLAHCIDPDEPDDDVPTSTRGLGIAPVVTLPHANREGRDALFARIISALGHRFEFVQITDDQAIVVTGEAWEARPSPCP